MKILNVGELKADFSHLMQEVKKGEKITIAFGKTHERLAVIIPYKEYMAQKGKRKIGILEGKASVAGRLAHQLLDEGQAAPYLLFMITRQLRLLVLAKGLGSSGASISEIRDGLGISSDYVLRKTVEQARRYSIGRLEQAYRKLLETDVSIKTGRRREELALDLLLTELCQGS